MKKILKFDNLKKYFPFVIFLIYVLYLHINMTAIYEDDIWFSNFKGQSLINIMVNRYNTWTSRFILDTLLFLINSYVPMLWYFIDILMCLLIYYSLNKILNPKKSLFIKLMIVISFMLYSFIDMGSAGWKTTTIVYIWPLALCLYSFIPITKVLRNEKISKSEIFLGVISLFAGINQEQCCLLYFGFMIVFMIHYYIKNKKVNKFFLIYFIIITINLINHLFCPGNIVRLNSSIDMFFIDYNEMNIIQKILLSFNNTYQMLLGQQNYIFIFINLLMFVSLINKKENKVIIFISLLMLIGAIIIPKLNIFRLHDIYYSLEFDKYKILPLLGLGAKSYKLSVLVSIFYTIMSMFILFKIFNNKKEESLLYPIVYLAAILSRLAIGFSPTLYVSGYRTGIFMLFLLIILSVSLIKNIKMNAEIKKCILLVSVVLVLLAHFVSIVPNWRL